MSMRDYKFTLATGQERSLNVEGDWFHVLESDGDIKIRFDDGVQINRAQGQGGSRSYKRVTVYSPIAQVVTLSLGYGQETDSRASVNATIHTTTEVSNVVTHHPKIVVLAGQTNQLLPSDATRKQVRVNINSEQDGGLYLGGVNLASAPGEGSFLDIGTTDYIDTQGALYARNDNAFDVEISIMTMERV